MSAVPVLAANVHSALAQADFEGLANAERSAAVALAEVRALQSAFVCAQFNAPHAALRSADATAVGWHLHALLAEDEGRVRRETVQAVRPSPGLAPVQQLRQYMLLLARLPNFWLGAQALQQQLLAGASGAQQQFAQDWTPVQLEVRLLASSACACMYAGCRH